MKKQFIFWFTTMLLVHLCINNSVAQTDKNPPETPKWHLKTGFGYYNPMAAGGKGNIFFSELGYTLPTRFTVGVGFGLSDVFETYSNDVPLFEGFRTYHNYYLIRLFVDRNFFPGKRHRFSLGTGLLYNQIRFSEPEVFVFPQHNDQGEVIGHELYIDLFKSNSNYIELGALLKMDYAYHFGKIGVGFRSEIHYLYDSGFGGLVISPQLSFSF